MTPGNDDFTNYGIDGINRFEDSDSETNCQNIDIGDFNNVPSIAGIDVSGLYDAHTSDDPDEYQRLHQANHGIHLSRRKNQENNKTSKGGLLARMKNYFNDEEFAQLMDECELNEETRDTLRKFKNLE